MTGWALRVTGPARRQINEELPEAVAAAAIEFITGPLIENPRRVGAALRWELSGIHVARRGTYRVLYEIHDDKGVVEVHDVTHRRDVYRRR